MTVFKSSKRTKFKELLITPCPEWLETTCIECGNDAYPSKFYANERPTLIQLDDVGPMVLCDICREKFFKPIGKRQLLTKEVPPNQDRLVLRGRIEWSVNGDKWYGLKHRNIIPYSNLSKDKNKVIMTANKLLNKMYEGKVVRGKAQYHKETQILKLNIDSFD